MSESEVAWAWTKGLIVGALVGSLPFFLGLVILL